MYKPSHLYRSLCLVALLSTFATSNADVQFSGKSVLEQRYFPQQPAYAGQPSTQASLAFAPEIFTAISDDLVFSAQPFVRIDQRDDERTLVDVRELMLAYYADNFELRAGIGKVFWGQTESLHLVDIINQTDAVASVDGEDKLGQPMLDIRYLSDLGTFTAYILPYFRERTFSGKNGRIRPAMVVDTQQALYESSDQQHHIDLALRWQHSWGGADLGISYFDGTDRMPKLELIADANNASGMALVPRYNQLQQVSVDALYMYEAFLFKLEAIRGETLGETHHAAVAGFEYSMVNVFDSGFDVGYLMEYQYDQRDDHAMIVGQNDLMVGARLAFNDFSSSEVLFGYVQDLEHSSSAQAFIEGGTRINPNWRLQVNGYFFTTDSPDDALYQMQRDDHFSVAVEYYF